MTSTDFLLRGNWPAPTDIRFGVGSHRRTAAGLPEPPHGPAVARQAATDGNAPTNPVPVGAAEVRHIFEQVLASAL